MHNINFNNITEEIKKYPNWVLYKLEDTGKSKLDKIPYDAKTGKRASSTDSKTWSTYTDVIETLSKSNGHYSGIGFVFSNNAHICGIDLDKCIEDGKILPWAQTIIDKFKSFTEISPSGKGVHIYIIAKKPGKNCRKDDIEIYDDGRFFTVTGNVFPGSPHTINNRQEELNIFYNEIFKKPLPQNTTPINKTYSMSDQDLIEKILASKQGKKFKALWEGDTSSYNNDDSSADQALCNMLAFWTGKDHNRIDILFRQSGLMRTKWNEKHGECTYGDRTIEKAINDTTESYKEKKLNHSPSTSEHKDLSHNGRKNIIEELNKKHAVLMIGGKCVVLNETIDYTFNRPDISFSNPTDFKNFYANKFVTITTDAGKEKKIPLGKYWFEHPERRQYQGIVFSPSSETPGYFNLFSGFAVEPKEGDCSLYLDHLYQNISSGNIENYNYLIAWMADCVQNPADRKGTSVVLRGKQGTGKGVAISEFAKIFGHHFVHVQHTRHLVGNFNAHLKDVLLVFADEAFWAGDKAAEGVLKAMVTEEYMQIEPKGKDSFRIKNHIHLMISSNNDWVVPTSQIIWPKLSGLVPDYLTSFPE